MDPLFPFDDNKNSVGRFGSGMGARNEIVSDNPQDSSFLGKLGNILDKIGKINPKVSTTVDTNVTFDYAMIIKVMAIGALIWFGFGALFSRRHK